MNSTLQLLLTGLDHAEECSIHGSPLWDILMYLKNQDKITPLDPSPVKMLLLTKESQRISSNERLKNKLFSSIEDHPLDLNLRIGQQDARDFFICIKENQQQWNDVFDKFKIKTGSYTSCLGCGHNSIQSRENESIFLELECPEPGKLMSEFVYEKLNSPQVVCEWRDEDGCGQQAGGQNYSKGRLQN